MKATRLAQVLHELTVDIPSAKQGTAVTSFISFIQSRGYEKLWPQILHAYEDIKKRGKKSEVVVTCGSKKVDEKHIMVLHNIKEKSDTYIDKTLIGGYTIETPTQFIDASHKNALVRLYRSLTN